MNDGDWPTTVQPKVLKNPSLFLMSGFRDQQQKCHSFACFWSMLVSAGVFPFANWTLCTGVTSEEKRAQCVSSLLSGFLACPLFHYSLERHIKGVLCMYSPKPSWKKEKNIHISQFFKKKNSGKLYNMMENWGQGLIHPLVRNPKFPFFAAWRQPAPRWCSYACTTYTTLRPSSSSSIDLFYNHPFYLLLFSRDGC